AQPSLLTASASAADTRFTRAPLATGPQSRLCTEVLPGTHRQELPRERYDERLFLRTDLPENEALLRSAVHVDLEPGDVLLFHARLFHAASRNHTRDTKYSVVASYRRLDNLPVPGTRSAQLD
ncbi:MAG: phytanoyl-CoA dioxygenase family protein, partial [Myxococcaceae bacterium]|nr:phytanoyl-CoA dioxygenase family protein [Myxococcaceae bacterium]MCI0673708.1 phytanoyl-CoA dioxygenase family protein [Myxococcaceae bacterium]